MMGYIEYDQKIIQRMRGIQLEILDEVVRICKKHDIQYFLIAGTLLGAVRNQGFIPWDDDIDIGMTRKDYDKFIETAKEELSDEYYMHNMVTDYSFWDIFTKIKKNNTEFLVDRTIGKNTHKGIYIDIFPFENANAISSLPIKIQSLFKVAILDWIHYRHGFKKIKELSYRFVSILFIPFSNQTLLRMANSVMTWNRNDESEYLISYAGIYSYRKDAVARNKLLPLKKIKFEGKEYYGMNDNDDYLARLYGDYMKLPPENERVNHTAYNISFTNGVSRRNNKIYK